MDAVECRISFGRQLNPSLERDAMSSRRKGVCVVKVINTVRTFMYDEVRPEFPVQYPRDGVEPEKGFSVSGETLVMVDVYLPSHEDMSSISSRLQRRLVDDLILNLPDVPADRIIVSVGPAAPSTAA